MSAQAGRRPLTSADILRLLTAVLERAAAREVKGRIYVVGAGPGVAMRAMATVPPG